MAERSRIRAAEAVSRGTVPPPGSDRAVVVTEVFRSIQGESSRAGRPCAFVRLTGCPLRCRWCDTTYAFQGGRRMEPDEILRAVAALGVPLVEVTGGEPLAQPGSRGLLWRLAESGHEVLLETGGAHTLEGVDPRVRVILDLKCPDSEMSAENRWENLGLLLPHDEVKFVLASRRDYEWARDATSAHRLAERNEVLFSPVWGELESRTLAEWVLEDRLAVRVQLPLHKLLFGADARGV